MEIFEIYGQQKTLTQWDMGRRLIVNGGCNQVHYANEIMTEAIVCQVEESDGVRTAVIPDEVLQVSGTLRVYAYLEDTESCTKHIQTFFVKARPKPADYVYTPTQWVKVEDILERVDALEKKEEADPTVPGWAKQVQKPAYTAAEVGAAPAGYGLGGNTTKLLDADAITATGFYVCDTNTPDNNWWYGIHVQYSEKYAYQEFCRYYDSGHHIFRKKVNGVWQPWDWVDPPMAVGVEYRTTERWNGKAVYTKAVDLGAAANGASVLFGVSGVIQMLRVHGFVGENPIPYDDGSAYCRLASATNACYVICSTHFVGQNVTAHLFYTKD